jgi:hypothetical protein
MSKRGTSIAVASDPNRQRRKVFSLRTAANTADNTHIAETRTIALTAVLGKTAKTLGVFGLGPVSTDVLDYVIYDIHDLDVTAETYIDLIYSWKGSIGNDEVLIVASKCTPFDYASGAANNVDEDLLVYTNQSFVSVTAATAVAADAGNARIMPILNIRPNKITSSDYGLAMRFTFTGTNVTAGEVVLHALRLRYTPKAGF